MTATSWLSFREFNGLLVYYTHLVLYRCAIREVRVVNRAGQGLEDAAVRYQGSERDSHDAQLYLKLAPFDVCRLN